MMSRTFEVKDNSFKVKMSDGQPLEFSIIEIQEFQELLKSGSWVQDDELTKMFFDIPVYEHKESNRILRDMGNQGVLFHDKKDFLRSFRKIQILPDMERGVQYCTLSIDKNEIDKILGDSQFGLKLISELSEDKSYYTYLANNGEILCAYYRSGGYWIADFDDYRHFMKYMLQADLPIPVIIYIPKD